MRQALLCEDLPADDRIQEHFRKQITVSLSRYFENARLHDRFIVRFWSCDFFRTMKYTQIVYCVFVCTSDSCGWWRSLLKILHQTTTTTHSLPQNGLANRSRGVVYMRDVCLFMSYDTVSCDVIGKKIDLLCTQILVNSLR